MVEQKPANDDVLTAEALRSALKNQYHAALAMLRQAIELCPDRVWAGGDHLNPFWRIAYHALYFVHLYIQPHMAAFRPWEHHQTGIQYLDDTGAPAEIEKYTELPHRPPKTGEPYTKAQILEYWTFCEQMIDRAVDALDLASPESGFTWYPIPKLEHQVVAIRHLQHHTGQLGDRVRAAADVGVEWTGRRRSCQI